MATIAAGNHVEVYVPLAGDITITPGTGGYVEFGCSSPSGESAPEGRRLYAAAAIAIPAGSTMFLRAEGEDATYTDPATSGGVVTGYTAAQLSALAAAGGLTPYATYVESDTGYWNRATSDSTYVRFSNARLRGDIRALLLLPTTKVSVHGASGVVSSGPGHLFGFIVVHQGSSPTMTVYDNASAASGSVLRTVAASEMTRGGVFIPCGDDGIDFSAGCYVALGGGTAPIVLAIFEGTYPAVTFTGTERWFDGTNGSDSNDGLTINTPRRSISGAHSYNSGNHIWNFKRGTEIERHRDGGSSIVMTGTNILFRDYGDPAAAKPIIWEDANEVPISFETTATTGNVRIENLRFEYREASFKAGSTPFNCSEGCQVEFNNCEADGYELGFAVAGNYSRIVDCTAERFSKGFLTGDSTAATPNYTLIFRCQSLSSSGAADTFMIGPGNGAAAVGTCLVASTGRAESVIESAVDIYAANDKGLLAFNDFWGGDSTATPPVVTDDATDDWTFIGNRIIGRTDTGNYCTMLLRGINPTVVGNYVYGNATSGGAAVLGIKSTATGCHITNNVFEAGSAATSAVSFRQDSLAGSSGTFSNNIAITQATSAGRVIIFNSAANYDAWAMSNNCYYTPNGARYADGTADHTTFAAYLAAAQADAHEAGTVNQNPALTSDYRLPTGSALIGAGATPTLLFLGRYGPIWTLGNVSIGLDDPRVTA